MRTLGSNLDSASSDAEPWRILRGPDAAPILSAMPDRFSQLLKQWSDRTPDNCAIIHEGRRISYREMWQKTMAAADWLRNMGVRAGDRVMLVGENGPQVVALLFAVSEIGAWIVPFNARMSKREIDNVAAFSGCRIVVYCLDGSEAASAHADEVGATKAAEGFGMIAHGLVDTNVRTEPIYNDKARDTAVLVYTSGTTGNPKGVMLSHQALMYMGGNMAILRGFTADDVLYSSSPISHIIGLGTVLLTAFWSGGAIELSSRFSPERIIDAITSGRVTCITGVPTLFTRLLDHAESARISLSGRRIRIVATAGAPLSLAAKERIESAFGVRMYNSYGLTECVPVARSASAIVDNEVGELQPGIEIRLVRADGRDAEVGEPGEIWTRGPPLMLGYYKDEQAKAAAFKPGGFVATGDLGAVDEAGLLRIVGRTKDVIIRSGFNVYPVELEAVIGEVPGVALVAVIGRELDGNEEIVAYIQLIPGQTVLKEQIVDWCRKQLAPYKQPSHIFIRDALPVGETGKILKNKLKELDAQLSASLQ